MFYDTIENTDEGGHPEVDATEVPRDELLAAALEALCIRWEEHANELEADDNTLTWAISQEKASVYMHVASSIRREIAYANITHTVAEYHSEVVVAVDASGTAGLVDIPLPTEDVPDSTAVRHVRRALRTASGKGDTSRAVPSRSAARH